MVVPRFGYDRPGRVVKLDPRKNTATVAIGMMQWEVPIPELIPQLVKTPDASASPERSKAAAARNMPRLEDFDGS